MSLPHPAPLIGTDPTFTADRLTRLRSADHAQIRIRRAIDTLKLANHDLLLAVDCCTDPDVSDAAQAARDQVDNAIQEAECALRYAVSASGVEVVERPKYAAVPHVRSKT